MFTNNKLEQMTIFCTVDKAVRDDQVCWPSKEASIPAKM
jgi:hypothetical protein